MGWARQVRVGPLPREAEAGALKDVGHRRRGWARGADAQAHSAHGHSRAPRPGLRPVGRNSMRRPGGCCVSGGVRVRHGRAQRRAPALAAEQHRVRRRHERPPELQELIQVSAQLRRQRQRRALSVGAAGLVVARAVFDGPPPRRVAQQRAANLRPGLGHRVGTGLSAPHRCACWPPKPGRQPTSSSRSVR